LGYSQGQFHIGIIPQLLLKEPIDKMEYDCEGESGDDKSCKSGKMNLRDNDISKVDTGKNK
jgi:hypothetical protein